MILQSEQKFLQVNWKKNWKTILIQTAIIKLKINLIYKMDNQNFPSQSKI